MTTGALSLVRTALAAGVEVCFANPGTTEMPIVAALDRTPGFRVVLGLFEGVCTGAADGWARMRGTPAATLLHLGPGLANGYANLHNARRAGTPLVNWIGDHASRHLPFDPPLKTDITALAGSVGWCRSVRSAAEMAEASVAAVKAALGPPGGVATLILPSECQWEPGPAPLSLTPTARRRSPGADDLRQAAALLRRGKTGLLLGGDALTVAGLRAAGRLAAAVSCPVWVETFPSRRECGRHVPHFPALPYFPEQAAGALGGLDGLVLAGARDPIAFFAYPDQPSRLLPAGAARCVLADPAGDVHAGLALEALAAEMNATVEPEVPSNRAEFLPRPLTLTPDGLCRTLAALLPGNAIVVNEATTTGLSWNAVHAGRAAPHTMLFITGGAIGQGLPNALGAAIACPDRRVVAFQADGSGLYTLQALWSMARENVDVTVVICANRCYRILQVELARAGHEHPGPTALGLTDLTRPTLDWQALAEGFGMPACRVDTEAALAGALARSFRRSGPCLIEAVLVEEGAQGPLQN